MFLLKTGIPVIDDLLEQGKGEIIEIEPLSYLKLSAYLKGISYERELNRVKKDIECLNELKHKAKSGIKLYLPYLDFLRNEQDGAHRAYVAHLLGLPSIPVAVIGVSSKLWLDALLKII